MKRLVPFALLPMLALAGCGSSPQDRASLKLFVFDCGRLSFDNLQLFGIDDHETDVRELIVPCYVIEHEEGRLLWEGGLPSSLEQVEDFLETAIDECERFYPAFQYVLWGGKDAGEAIAAAMIETVGEA